MLKRDVVIGGTYKATVSGKRTTVRIARNHEYGKGWVAVNLATGRAVYIRTAARLQPLPTKEKPCQTEARSTES